MDANQGQFNKRLVDFNSAFPSPTVSFSLLVVEWEHIPCFPKGIEAKWNANNLILE